MSFSAILFQKWKKNRPRKIARNVSLYVSWVDMDSVYKKLHLIRGLFFRICLLRKRSVLFALQDAMERRFASPCQRLYLWQNVRIIIVSCLFSCTQTATSKCWKKWQITSVVITSIWRFCSKIILNELTFFLLRISLSSVLNFIFSFTNYCKNLHKFIKFLKTTIVVNMSSVPPIESLYLPCFSTNCWK